MTGPNSIICPTRILCRTFEQGSTCAAQRRQQPDNIQGSCRDEGAPGWHAEVVSRAASLIVQPVILLCDQSAAGTIPPNSYLETEHPELVACEQLFASIHRALLRLLLLHLHLGCMLVALRWLLGPAHYRERRVLNPRGMLFLWLLLCLWVRDQWYSSMRI